MSSSKPAGSQIAKQGLNILKRLVFDEATLAPENRRAENRDQVAGEVEVMILDEAQNTVGTARVFIRDVSKGGCGLWSRVPVPSGCVVIVKFPAMNGQPPMGKMARVQHCRGQKGTGFAVGLRFLDADRKTKAA